MLYRDLRSRKCFMAWAQVVAYVYACVVARKCLRARSFTEFSVVVQRWCNALRVPGRLHGCIVVVAWCSIVRVNHCTASESLAWCVSCSHVSTSITSRSCGVLRLCFWVNPVGAPTMFRRFVVFHVVCRVVQYVRRHGARRGFCPKHLLGAVYPEGCTELPVADSSPCPTMAFGTVGVPPFSRGVARVADRHPLDILRVWEGVRHVSCFLGCRFVWLSQAVVGQPMGCYL